MPVIGFLGGGTQDTYASYVDGFRRGLVAAGRVEGRDATIELHWLEGHYDRAAALAEQLVRRQVAVIAVTGSTAVALAAKAATTTIPIVFAVGGDPVKFGLVASLNRPGGNVTESEFSGQPAYHQTVRGGARSYPESGCDRLPREPRQSEC